jgi:hypothetical protein
MILLKDLSYTTGSGFNLSIGWQETASDDEAPDLIGCVLDGIDCDFCLDHEMNTGEPASFIRQYRLSGGRVKIFLTKPVYGK